MPPRCFSGATSRRDLPFPRSACDGVARPEGRHYDCGYARQLSHVNSRVRGAKVAEDLVLIVAAEAVA